MFRVAQGEGLSIPDSIFATKLSKDTIVKISANRTVAKAGAGDVIFGRVSVPSKDINLEGTVETYFRERHDLATTTTIAAGDFFKMAAPDGTTGDNRVAKWVSGTDAEELKCGICFKGGSTNAIVEVFFR